MKDIAKNLDKELVNRLQALVELDNDEFESKSKELREDIDEFKDLVNASISTTLLMLDCLEGNL